MEWLAVILTYLALIGAVAILAKRVEEVRHLVNFAFDRLAAPVTPEHIATLAQGIQEGNASLLGAIAATTEIRDGQAGRLAILREALRAYELSHAHTQTHTVNGFTRTETILCDCALCSAARDALG